MNYDLSKIIRKRRSELNMSQSELARRTGINRSTISKIESGKRRKPNFDTLDRIAEIIEIDPLTLFELAGYSFDEINEAFDFDEPEYECLYDYEIIIRGKDLAYADSIEELKEIIRETVTRHAVNIYKNAKEDKFINTDDNYDCRFRILSGDFYE